MEFPHIDLSQVKDLSSIAGPFIKVLVEQFIAPKAKQLVEEKTLSIKMTSHAFINHFEVYLHKAYIKHSSMSVLVLGNTQKKIDDLYIPLEVIREDDESQKYLIDGFNSDFIPFYKKVLITDTAGMGKSTISKKIFLSVINQQAGVPVLIELRRLNSSKRLIDEIFRQLSLINEGVDESFVLELIHRGGFIFILDGFDEIEKDDRKYVVEDIINFVDKANENYFLMTSRPEDAVKAFGDFMEFSIRPLVKKEAYDLLRKYDSGGEISTLLIGKLKESGGESVAEFLTNPLLVSLLFTAFDAKHTIPLKKHMFYRQVYDAFFEKHDLTKGDSYARNKYTKLESDDFHRVLRHIAYACTRMGKIEFSKDEVINLIEEASVACVGLNFKAADFLKDVLSKVPLFVQDGLYYKWAHKSIQEYFSANFIYIDAKSSQGAILMALVKNVENKHENLLDIYYSLDYKSYRRFIIYDLLKYYFDFLAEVKALWPNISPAMSTKLFSAIYYFTKYEHKPVKGEEYGARFEEAVSRLKKEIPIFTGGHSWSIMVKFMDKQIKYDHVKVFNLKSGFSNTIIFLFNKRANFISIVPTNIAANFDNEFAPDDESKDNVFVPNSECDLRDMPMEEGRFYVLHGSDSSDLFKKIDINRLSAEFITPDFFFKENEARKIMHEIEIEISKEQTADFLTAGL